MYYFIWKNVETYQIEPFPVLSLAVRKQSCDLIRAHDESSRTSSAQFPESRRRFCNIYQRWSFLYLVFHSNTYFPKHRLFLLKPGLKLGHHLVDGRIVSVYMVARFHFQPRLSLHVITHKVLKVARWRLSECPGFL